MASRRNVGYKPLPTEDNYVNDDEDRAKEDMRYAYSPQSYNRIPWKSIALAIFLLLLGSCLLFVSFFIFTGHMGGDRSQSYGFWSSVFLPFFQVSTRHEMLTMHGGVPEATLLLVSLITSSSKSFLNIAYISLP